MARVISAFRKEITAFNYDALNRIDDAKEVIGSTVTWKQDYTFDRYGNRNLVETNTTTIPRNCVDNQTPPNPTICAEDRKMMNPSVNAANNRLSSSDGYQFDAAGNTIRDPQFRKFTYDAENKQTKVETVDANGNVTGTLGQYSYDGDGRRVKKIAYTNNQPTETTVFIYDASSRLVAEYSTTQNPTPQVAYLTNDHLGSPRINTNENGAIISRHDYRPYGEEVTERTHAQYTADTIRKQFTGYERDNESDLDYAKARMYKPSHGRFTAVDPLMASARRTIPQSWNRYTYVLNNPLRLVDPTGMVWGYRSLKDGSTEYCFAKGKAVCDGFKRYTGDGILENPSVNGRELGYAIRLLRGGGWERIVPIDAQGQGRSWLSQKDIVAINAVSAGALCSLSAGLACPSSMDQGISDRVQTAGDIAQLPFLVKSLLKAGLSFAAIAIILKKDPDDIAKIAAKVAGNFRNLECRECAEALLKEFNKAGISGTLRELTSNGAPMVRAGQNTGEAISLSGRHFGVQVGETIYDLYHPGGIPVNDWKNAYESIKGVELVPLKPQ